MSRFKLTLPKEVVLKAACTACDAHLEVFERNCKYFENEAESLLAKLREHEKKATKWYGFLLSPPINKNIFSSVTDVSRERLKEATRFRNMVLHCTDENISLSSDHWIGEWL